MSFFGGDGDEPFSAGEARIRVETEKAILVELDNEVVWIPKSAIHDDSEVWNKENGKGELVVKAWFARKEGWE